MSSTSTWSGAHYSTPSEKRVSCDLESADIQSLLVLVTTSKTNSGMETAMPKGGRTGLDGLPLSVSTRETGMA